MTTRSTAAERRAEGVEPHHTLMDSRVEREPSDRALAARWITACALGEALGIAAVATTYAAIDRGHPAPAAPWILGAGAWEGLCLGGAQAVVLRGLGVRPRIWIALTVLAAAAGYGLSLLGGAGGGGEGSEPELAALLGLGAAMGAVMGALMGAIQWAGARGRLSALSWIGASALGWAPAMAVIMIVATSVEGSWPLYCIALAGAGAGVIAGLFVGAATMLALPRSGAPSDV